MLRMSADLYAKLAARLGPKGCATDPDTLATYLTEWRGKYRGATPFLALPASTEEAVNIIFCSRQRQCNWRAVNLYGVRPRYDRQSECRRAQAKQNGQNQAGPASHYYTLFSNENRS